MNIEKNKKRILAGIAALIALIAIIAGLFLGGNKTEDQSQVTENGLY